MHISQLLVQHRIDINLINHTDGQSALHLATIQQNVKMICLLLQSHAWPFIPDKVCIYIMMYTNDTDIIIYDMIESYLAIVLYHRSSHSTLFTGTNHHHTTYYYYIFILILL